MESTRASAQTSARGVGEVAYGSVGRSSIVDKGVMLGAWTVDGISVGEMFVVGVIAGVTGADDKGMSGVFCCAIDSSWQAVNKKMKIHREMK
jgi:hypothetical protein